MRLWIHAVLLMLLSASLAGCIENSDDSDDDGGYTVTLQIDSPGDGQVVGEEFTAKGFMDAGSAAFEDEELRLMLFIDEKYIADVPMEEEWQLRLSAAAVPDGLHDLTLRAMKDEEMLAEYTVIIIIDRTAPQVELKNPGEFVHGPVSIGLSGDLDDLAYSHFIVDGKLRRNTTSSYFLWDTTTEVEGIHLLAATAIDSAGNAHVCTPLELTVDNTPPDVYFLNPTDSGSESYSGTISVDVHASDDILARGSGVSTIEYFLDGSVDPAFTGDAEHSSFQLDTTLLEDNFHYLKVEVEDRCGHSTDTQISFLTDNTPPVISITSPPAVTSPPGGSYISGNILVDATLDDGAANSWGAVHAVLSMDGATVVSAPAAYDTEDDVFRASFPVNTWDYEEGAHTIRMTGIDLSGNSAYDEITCTIDNTPPTAEIISPGDGYLAGGIIRIETRVSDNFGISGTIFTIDDTRKELDAGSCEWDSSAVSDGVHSLLLETVDLAGNPGVHGIEVTVDNTPPELEISSPSGHRVRDMVMIVADVSDENGVGAVDFIIDGSTVFSDAEEPFEYEWNTTGYDDGDHEVELLAEDLAGNTISRIITTEVDNYNPLFVTIDSPSRGDYLRGAVDVLVDIEDEETDISYAAFFIDGVEEQNSTSHSFRWDTTRHGDGDHELEVQVRDENGNYNSNAIEVFTDNTAPEIDLGSPEHGDAVNEMCTMEWTCSDEESGIEHISLVMDGEDELYNGTGPGYDLDTSLFEDGMHDFTLTAVDRAGGSDSVEFSLEFDNTAPEVNITSPTDEYLRGTVDIRADVTEEGCGLEEVEIVIRDIDDEIVESAQGTSHEWDTTGVEDGPEYDIEVTARDRAGNEGQGVITVLVDNTPPEVTDISPADGSYVSGTVTISPTILETGSGLDRVIFRLNGDDVQDSTSRVYQWDTTVSGDGGQDISMTIYDRAGNSAGEAYTYIVDNTPPSVDITSPGEGARVIGDGTIAVDASDNTGGSGMQYVEFFFNGFLQFTDSAAPYEFDFASDDYTDGDYAVTVRAYDMAGNPAQDIVNIKLGEDNSPIVSDPHTSYLKRYNNIENMDRLMLDDYSMVPIVSSQVRHRGTMPSIDWDGAQNPKTNTMPIDMPATGYAGFAGNIAISYWDPSTGSADKAIVVDNYRHAVMITAYATIMNYPIVVYDSALPRITDEALWKLDTIYATQVITLGDTPYNNRGVTVFTEDDIVPATISAAQFMGISLDYIVVVNPDDTPSISNTGYLSSFAGVFAAYHNGLIVPSHASTSEMNSKIHDAIDALDAAGMPAKHVAIVGDHKSLPMINEGGTPSDNRYADLDGDKYTVELSIGRIFAKELDDLSYYADRVVNYADYLAINMATPPLRLQDPLHWNNNALIYMGVAAEFAEDSENHCREYMWAMGRFNSQDDSDKAHGLGGGPAIMQDLKLTNFFIINADHGYPEGTVTWSSQDLPDMHPGVTFGVSCSLGRVDGRNKDGTVTYTMLEKGMNVYLAPTRTAYGSFVQTYPYQPIAAPGLCYLYLRYIIDNDYDSGVAYMHAKNDLINNGYGGNVDKTTTWQYQHYGDPAFNPYEPCNEGWPL